MNYSADLAPEAEEAPRYEFETDDGRFRFFVFFLFGQDEMTLHILDRCGRRWSCRKS